MKRSRTLLAALGVSAAIACAGCGSSSPNATTTTATTRHVTATTTVKRDHGARATKAKAVRCLIAHDVPLTRVALLLGRTPAKSSASISDETLSAAGTACQSTLTATQAAAIRRLDKCIADHGIAAADSGSPLADILVLDPRSPKVRAAVSKCVIAQRPASRSATVNTDQS